jgi:hypothetical protein
LDYSSDSSIRSELGDVVEVLGPATGASSTSKKRRLTCKVALSKVGKGVGHPQRGGATASDAVDVEEEGVHEGTTNGGCDGLITLKLEEDLRVPQA